MMMTDAKMEQEWIDKLGKLPVETGRKMISWAASQLGEVKGGSEGERKIAIAQLRAALIVDPALYIEVMKSAFGPSSTADEVERWKEVAAQKEADFNGIVEGIKSLRSTLVELGGIAEGGRLPGTV